MSSLIWEENIEVIIDLTAYLIILEKLNKGVNQYTIVFSQYYLVLDFNFVDDQHQRSW